MLPGENRNYNHHQERTEKENGMDNEQKGDKEKIPKSYVKITKVIEQYLLHYKTENKVLSILRCSPKYREPPTYKHPHLRTRHHEPVFFIKIRT